MATQNQLEFFKYLFEYEVRRYQLLAERAKLYFAVISFYLGAIAFKFDDVAKFLLDSNVPLILVASTGAVVTAALLFCVLAMRIRRYEAICDPEKVVMTLTDEDLAEASFVDTRIGEFAFAAKRNGQENQRTARYLGICSALLFTSVMSTMGLFIYGLVTWRT